MGNRGVNIRPARPEDRPFIMGLAARLTSVAHMGWRSTAEIDDFQRSFMETCFANSAAATLLAWDGAEPQGFVHVEPAVDPMNGEACGYVSLLAVTEPAEGKGVAQALMTAAEEWSRRQGFRLLCLDVFAGNRRGRDFYARQGFGEETLRLVKALG